MEDILIRRIKDSMKTKNITQAELSKITGIRASSISDYLTGKYQPKQDKISLIAEALSVNPGWLMGYEDTQFTTNVANDLHDSHLPDPVYSKDEQELINMYRKLDIVDKAEIRGEIKGLLKADKYKPEVKDEVI